MKILMIFSKFKDLKRACSYQRKHDSLSAVRIYTLPNFSSNLVVLTSSLLPCKVSACWFTILVSLIVIELIEVETKS